MIEMAQPHARQANVARNVDVDVITATCDAFVRIVKMHRESCISFEYYYYSWFFGYARA